MVNAEMLPLWWWTWQWLCRGPDSGHSGFLSSGGHGSCLCGKCDAGLGACFRAGKTGPQPWAGPQTGPLVVRWG